MALLSPLGKRSYVSGVNEGSRCPLSEAPDKYLQEDGGFGRIQDCLSIDIFGGKIGAGLREWEMTDKDLMLRQTEALEKIAAALIRLDEQLNMVVLKLDWLTKVQGSPRPR